MKISFTTGASDRGRGREEGMREREKGGGKGRRQTPPCLVEGNNKDSSTPSGCSLRKSLRCPCWIDFSRSVDRRAGAGGLGGAGGRVGGVSGRGRRRGGRWEWLGVGEDEGRCAACVSFTGYYRSGLRY